MRRELPSFITDPSNQAKVEALIAGRRSALGHEETHKLASAWKSVNFFTLVFLIRLYNLNNI